MSFRNGFPRHWLFGQESCACVCFSCFESPCLYLSLLLSPLCLSPAPSTLGPPHQPTYLLPSPSHLTTQQVEHWFRTLLWPGSPCPDVSMVCSAQAWLPAGIPPSLAGLGCLTGFPSSLTSLLPSALLPSPFALSPALAALASALSGTCAIQGFPPAPCLPPQQTWRVHVPCWSVQASVESWNS